MGFNQSSKGDCTIKIFNNEIETTKFSDKVYAINELEELFKVESLKNLYLFR